MSGIDPSAVNYKGGFRGGPLLRADEVQRVVLQKGQEIQKKLPTIMAEIDSDIDETAEEIFTSLQKIGRTIEQLKPMKQELQNELRGLRMSAAREAKDMLGDLTDVRKFFLGDDHLKEMALLKDFVETCERLKALKESGFLDTVADTMLKLAK